MHYNFSINFIIKTKRSGQQAHNQLMGHQGVEEYSEKSPNFSNCVQ